MGIFDRLTKATTTKIIALFTVAQLGALQVSKIQGGEIVIGSPGEVVRGLERGDVHIPASMHYSDKEGFKEVFRYPIHVDVTHIAKFIKSTNYDDTEGPIGSYERAMGAMTTLVMEQLVREYQNAIYDAARDLDRLHQKVGQQRSQKDLTAIARGMASLKESGSEIHNEGGYSIEGDLKKNKNPLGITRARDFSAHQIPALRIAIQRLFSGEIEFQPKITESIKDPVTDSRAVQYVVSQLNKRGFNINYDSIQRLDQQTLTDLSIALRSNPDLDNVLSEDRVVTSRIILNFDLVGYGEVITIGVPSVAILPDEATMRQQLKEQGIIADRVEATIPRNTKSLKKRRGPKLPRAQSWRGGSPKVRRNGQRRQGAHGANRGGNF